VWCGLIISLNGDKGVESLTGQVVRNSHHRSLRNGRVFQQCRLDLGSRKSVAADIDNIVYSAANPIIPIWIPASSITRKLGPILLEKGVFTPTFSLMVCIGLTYIISFIRVEICVQKPPMVTVDSTRHTGPRLRNAQNSLFVAFTDNLPRDWVQQNQLNAEERQGGASWFCRRYACKGRQNIGTCFRLEVRLDAPC
jgi:hypothetical protein